MGALHGDVGDALDLSDLRGQRVAGEMVARQAVHTADELTTGRLSSSGRQRDLATGLAARVRRALVRFPIRISTRPDRARDAFHFRGAHREVLHAAAVLPRRGSSCAIHVSSVARWRRAAWSLQLGAILRGRAKPIHVAVPSVTARGIVNLTAIAVASRG
jgi:hypothetical protein